MGGGLMQLVAYGAQDIYLTGNPQITFFKVVYRRHTNFAVESIEQTHNGSVASGSKISVTVSRNGDLLSSVWLAMTQTGANGLDDMSDVEAIIDNVEVEVGGQVIDKQYGHWMKLWTDLTHDKDKADLLADSIKTAAAGDKAMVPLQFWFCRNPGLALPLIALQYHEVKLNVTFADTTKISGVEVWCDYVFLDTDERRRFAQVSHEYLIEQVQFSNRLNAGNGTGVAANGDNDDVIAGKIAASDAVNTQHELRFNHPVKELVWTVGSAARGDVEVEDALLQLNGHDRFKRRSGKYFTAVQRYQYHSGSEDSHEDLKPSKPHVYSFALKPEEHQPSGTCNFSRIDNAVLNMNYKALNEAHTLRVYAVNYNVLRIMSGMGGLAYSN